MRWKATAIGLALAGLSVVCGFVVSNNFRVSKSSRQEFGQRLTRTRELATDWVLTKDMADPGIHRERALDLLQNTALLYMLVDCDQLAKEHKFDPILQAFLRGAERSSWLRMVDPAKPFYPLEKQKFDRLLDYQRWFLWVLAPDQVQLDPAEKADLDCPDNMKRGRLTHQIFAWNLYRRLHGSTPERDKLIRHLCERAAGEAKLDFRVTDMYLQRIAFILHAGHPDLIQPRWVEHAVAGQQDDGGWTWAWHGWGPQAFQFRIPEEHSFAHPTAQGLWITYMLAYRYPEWISKNYD